jgi:DNA-binding NarL/FixJ family response regulator
METLLENESNTESQRSLPLSLLFDALAPLRFLVVEDDESQWPLWESILKTNYPRAEIDWETDELGAEALLRHAFQNNKPYSLVISDIFLEGPGTGIDLWNRYGEAAAHFIFVSSFSMDNFDSLMSSLVNSQNGTPMYLQKPLSPKVCKEAIASVI